MAFTRRRKIGAATMAMLLAGTGATFYVSQTYTIDAYKGQPQVVGLPAGYDPMAVMPPYAGPHPSLTGRPVDQFAYPITPGETGPVVPTYAKRLQYPFACRSEASGLGQPLVDNQEGAGTAVYAVDDAGNNTDRVVGYSQDCSIETRVAYYYRHKESREFLPLTGPDDDVEIVTLGGRHVPFIVRVETGTINRHIYIIALLRGPDDTPERPDLSYWNGNLLYQLRGGVGIGRRQGRIEPEYIPSRRHAELARGYAVAHSTANQTSTQYDMQLAEDTLARVKRQFVARYGKPQYTLGIGKSGGAIQQYLIGQNRPGLLDGGVAMAAYPDMITQTIPILDCELLEYFFDVVDGDNPKWRTWSQRSWILGLNARDDLPNTFERMRGLKALRNGGWPQIERGHTECTKSWRNLTPQIANPHYTYFASLFSPDVAARVPWTYWDDLKRFYGTDRHGYARRTWDNVGVQYGLGALKKGQITIEEFINLNVSIGGWKSSADMTRERFWMFAGGRSDLADLSVWSHHNMRNGHSEDTPAPRSVGDSDAIAAAYKSGQVFLGKLTMPIIDLRHYLEPSLDMHHSISSFSSRLRMLRTQGHADNQLIWFAEPPAAPIQEALALLERWLRDRANAPGSSLADTRPVDADDRCYDSRGQVVERGPGVWDGAWNGKEDGACTRRFPIYSTSRIVAGDDYVGDIFKCHLQSVDEAIARGLYEPVDVDAVRSRLIKIFPDGVCDYARGDAARPADLLSWNGVPLLP